MAEVSLDSLVIEIRARDERFMAAMRGIESRLDTFQTKVAASTKRVESAFGSLAGKVAIAQRAFATLASVAALGGLTRLAKGALDTASTLVDTADRIGITVEALQELQFAATQSGVSTESFAQSMQIFSRRLSEAAGGAGEAKDTLKALGLDAKALAKDPAKALTTIADKIAGITNQARRLEVINDIFGRGGAAMVNLLQQGGPALDAVRQKARDLGIVIEEDLARKSEELGDRFEAATQAIGVQFKTALLEVAPVIIKVAEAIAQGTKRTREFIEQIGKVGDIPKKLQLDLINRNIDTLEKKLSTTGGLSVFDHLIGGDEGAAQKRLAELRDAQKKLTAELTSFGNVAGGATSTAAKKLKGELEDLGGATSKAGDEFEKLIKRTKENAETMNLSGKALADYVAKQAKLDGASDDQVKRLHAAVLAEENAKAAKEAHTEAIQKQAEAQREAARIAKETAEDIRDAELLVNKLAADKLKLDQEEAQANAASLVQLQNEIATLHEEGRLIQASLRPKGELRDIELTIAKARIERQIATDLTTASENTLTQEEADAIKSKKALLVANAEATASFATMQDSIDQAALSTADLKTFTTGILQGTQDIGDLFEDLGQTMGVRLVDGVLFGKGQNEQAIIGNFNQLLGVQAAGLFGAQGTNLGNTLISSILDPIASGGKSLLSSIGFDIGSLFGSSAVDAASVTWEQAAPDIFAAGGAPLASAQAGGSTFGTIFGGIAAGAAGIAMGKGLASIFGLGGGKAASIGGTVGGGLGAITGGILGIAGGPAGVALGAAIGGAAGGLFGTLIGGLFKSTPSKGTEIRKGVKDFLKDIKVSFAKEIDSGDYFFEETKKLADKMFGGDFLDASKKVLNDEIGPDLANQLQALGTFITEKQASKLGKSVEQTGTTFGNLLLDNLGLDPETIDSAIQEIIRKANISFEMLVSKLNTLFDKGKISQDFFNDTIMGTVEIFSGDLPAAINVSSIALKSFSEDGLFDLEKFNAEVQKTTDTFEIIVSAFVDVVKNSNPGEEIGQLLAQQINKGLRDLAVDAFLQDFVDNKLFEGIDLSDGLGADELALITSRAGDARLAVDTLKESFGDVGDEVESAADKVEDLFDKIRSLTQQRFDLRIDVIGDLAAIGAVSGVGAARAGIAGAQSRLAGLGAATRTNFTDLELDEGLDALRSLRQATVELFQAQEQEAQDALQNRIRDINIDYEARRNALQRETDAAQEASEARVQQLTREREDTQSLFQERIDGLQEELRVAEDFRRLAQDLQQTINGLVQSASPFSQQEQFGVFQRQAAELRQRIAGTASDQQAPLIQELSQLLSTQLSLGKNFLDPTTFGNLFNSITGELQQLRDQATTEGDRVEAIQQEIAFTTAQMEVQLRSIDASIQQAQSDAQEMQRFAQQQAERLSLEEQQAVAAAERATAAELSITRAEIAQEIRNLAVLEDQILAEQLARAQEQVSLTAEQVSVLHSIDAGISTLTGQFIQLFNGIISAASGFAGTVKSPQLFLAHPNEHVRITPPGQSAGGPINVNIPLSISVNGGKNNPQATEEAIIQLIVDNIRKGRVLRDVIQGVK